MEARINYHIQGIFMLGEKTIPTTLSKHLTNKIFNKPNKDAMEQVLYYLLPLINPNCLKILPWPITTFKEAAEFRNAATVIINGLNGFVYEKSANVVGKVNSSLLANPGGPVFVFFMYQLCVFIKFCELKKKGIDVLNAPSYVEDEYIDKKIMMFDGISKSNFNKANEIMSRIDFDLKNTSELAIKYKEIIQNSKQRLKDFKFELLNIEHCEVTEIEVVELRQKYIDLYNTFDKNKLIAMKCSRLADLILKTPEIWDAYNINKGELSIISLNDGKVDLIELLINIKTILNSYINWCEQLNNEEKINEKISNIQQLIIDMTEQIQCYEKLMKVQNNKIDNLKIKNIELELHVFTGNSLEKIDPRLQSLYKKIAPVILKTNFTDKSHVLTPEITKKSRRSVLLHCNSEPYKYQIISSDDIGNVYRATFPSSNQNNDAQSENDDNEHSLMQHESYQIYKSFQKDDNIKSQHTISEMETAGINIGPQTKEDEVKSVSISRKSIENMKQKLIRIKTQAQSMSTIPHSPQSPF